MCKWCFLILLIIPSLFSAAQYLGYTQIENTPSFRQQFVQGSEKINSIKCDFVQEKNLSMLSEKIISKGKFWYKKDKRIRMEYDDPFQYLMILNNDNVYVKDGQKENTVSTRSNALFRQINAIMIDCVKGNFLGNPDFSIKVFENGSTFLIELSPLAKNLKAYFKNISVIIDKKDYSADSIDMVELAGDNTVIHFINKLLNSNIPDELFTIH